MGQDGFLLRRLQQHRALVSYKADDLLGANGGELVVEAGFYAALDDVVELVLAAGQQGLQPASDGYVDQQEEVLDEGFVGLGWLQELAPGEVQDGTVFFGGDAEEHYLDDRLAEVQAEEGLQLPSEGLVSDLRLGLLLLLQPVKPASYTQL